MTAVQTLREPKAERLLGEPVPPNRMKIDEPEETPLEWYRRWCREVTEWQEQQGLLDEEPPSMEEIVAICNEVRAERYARKQNEAAGH